MAEVSRENPGMHGVQTLCGMTPASTHDLLCCKKTVPPCSPFSTHPYRFPFFFWETGWVRWFKSDSNRPVILNTNQHLFLNPGLAQAVGDNYVWIECPVVLDSFFQV